MFGDCDVESLERFAGVDHVEWFEWLSNPLEALADVSLCEFAEIHGMLPGAQITDFSPVALLFNAHRIDCSALRA